MFSLQSLIQSNFQKHKINHKNSSKPGLFLKVNVIIGHKDFIVKKPSCSVLPRYLKLG